MLLAVLVQQCLGQDGHPRMPERDERPCRELRRNRLEHRRSMPSLMEHQQDGMLMARSLGSLSSQRRTVATSSGSASSAEAITSSRVQSRGSSARIQPFHLAAPAGSEGLPGAARRSLRHTVSRSSRGSAAVRTEARRACDVPAFACVARGRPVCRHDAPSPSRSTRHVRAVECRELRGLLHRRTGRVGERNNPRFCRYYPRFVEL